MAIKVKKTCRSTRLRSTLSIPSPSISDSAALLHQDIVRYGVGLDVHKMNIVVCVKAQLRDAVIITIRTQTFSSNPQGLRDLIAFLRKYVPVARYLMECTGVYHLPVYQALITAFPEDQKKVVAMNPLLLHH